MKSTTTRLMTQIGTGATLMTLTVGTALACNPIGVITKGVTNLSSGQTAVMAADTTTAAISAKPGDTLKYTIVIADRATKNSSDEDMIETQLIDSLPAGLTLVSGKATDTVGTVKAQKSVTSEITVKVNTDVKDGQIIDNKACFTGEAVNHDKNQHQAGCDHAIVKVSASKVTPAPTPVSTPVATPAPTPVKTPEVLSIATQAPATLPVTGGATSSTVGLLAMVSTGFAYLKSRNNR